MKRLVISCLFIVLSTSPTFAQTPREALIDLAAATYLQNTLLSAESPMLDMWLQEPKAKNRQVSDETWRDIKGKFAVSLSSVLGKKDGMLDKMLRHSLNSLSDAELQRIVEILNDPTYARFQKIMASPESQKQLLQVMISDAFAMQAALNDILREYGLNEVH